MVEHDVLCEPRLPRSALSKPFERRGLELALRFCRDGSERLVDRFKRVPESYVDPEAGVACPCGAHTVPREWLVPCVGDCGRWFCGDRSGIWSVQL